MVDNSSSDNKSLISGSPLLLMGMAHIMLVPVVQVHP